MKARVDHKQDGWAIAALMLVALEFLSAMGWISRLVPIVYTDPATGLPQVIPPGLEPEREMMLYGICGAFIVAAGLLVFVRRPRLPGVYVRTLPYFVAVQAALVLAQLACAFKLITYHHPFYPVLVFENSQWILPLVCGIFSVSLLSKIFWPECVGLVTLFAPRLHAWRPSRWSIAAGDAAVVAATAVLLWIPDARIPLALGFWSDRLIGVDQRTGWLMGLGWDYTGTLNLLLAGAVAKTLFFYGALRLWGVSFWFGVAGLLWFIRWQCFYYDPNPTGWLTGVDFSLPLVMAGLDNGPMFAPLRMRQFWAFDMNFAIPVIYMIILFVVAARHMSRKLSRDAMIVMGVSIVGLIVFADAIMRPSAGRYAVCGWPLIALAVWGADRAAGRWFPAGRKWAGLAAAVLMLVTLLTNRVFLVYPNLFNAGSDRFNRLVEPWVNIWDFSAKAAFIQKIVPAGQPAAVISSFECRLLQQADRRTIWPVMPLLQSQYPGQNVLPVLAVWQKSKLARILDTLQARQPEYIFVEVKLWQTFKSSPDRGTGLGVLMDYVINHYDPVAQEDFLVAVKRKD